jgi:hypothetical protein
MRPSYACVVDAAVLAVAADAGLVAHHLQKLDAHLVSALARLRVKISREEAAWRREARGRKGREGAEKGKKFRVLARHRKQEMPVARARVSRTRE